MPRATEHRRTPSNPARRDNRRRGETLTNEKFSSPARREAEARGSAAGAAHLSPFLTPVDVQLLPAATILCLADRVFARNMAGGLLDLGRRACCDACRGRVMDDSVMDDKSGESSRRPISLALACVAAVGWLIAASVWWQSSETQSQLNQSLTAAEQARESLASDLQNLQKTAGTAADLKKQAADAEKALSDAAAARASAQNELADLTKQINDAKLAISGAQEEASARTRDLQAVDTRLKDETDRVATLGSQDQALSTEQSRLQGDVETARKALAEAQTATAAAQKEYQALQGQISAANAELNAIEAQIRAAKPEPNSTQPSPNP
jgi:predicted  nucleic acid-binding Zn-ribbon protein